MGLSAQPPNWRINFSHLTFSYNCFANKCYGIRKITDTVNKKSCWKLCFRPLHWRRAGGLGSFFCSFLQFPSRPPCSRPLHNFLNHSCNFVAGKKCNIILSKSDGPAWGKNVKRSQESVGQNCRRQLQGWFQPTGAGASDPNMDLH